MQRWGLACALALVTGCYTGWSPGPADLDPSAGGGGSATDSDGGPGRDDDGDDDEPMAEKCGDGLTQQSTLRRLNRREFRNTLRDLFALPTLPEFPLPQDQLSSHGLDNDGAALSLDMAAAEKYFDAAEAVAEALRNEGTPPLLECAGLVGGALSSCADEQLADWLAYAFRRPVSAETVALARELIGSPADYDELVDAVVTFTVTSPLFLFHMKTDAAAQTDELADAFEVADRLAFMVWSSTPDRALLDAAAANKLRTPKQLEAQVDRMLADERAVRFYDDFAGLWLRLNRLGERPEAEEDAQLIADMREETTEFFREVLTGGEPFANLIDSNRSVLNGRLAAYYGIETELGPDEWGPTELPPERTGLLTHAGVLAIAAGIDFSDPIRRGVFVAERVLCSEPPPPPFDPPPLPSPDPLTGDTVRDVLERHREDPTCAPCHGLIDPLGLALESYDMMGLHRETYPDGSEIDASGELATGERFDDAIDLSRVIAEGEDFESCVASLLLTYGVGRDLSDDEECYVELALEQSRGATFREFLVSFVSSYLFVATGEEA